MFNKILYVIFSIIIIVLTYKIVDYWHSIKKISKFYDETKVILADKEKEISIFSDKLNKVLEDLNNEKKQTSYYYKLYKDASGKIISKEIIKEIPVECKTCFENYARPITVENDKWKFSDDNCLDDIPGNLELKDGFKKDIIDTYLETQLAIENRFITLRLGLSADITTDLNRGAGLSLEILNLKKLFKIPIGLGVQGIIDFENMKNSRIGGNLHYRIFKNLAIGTSGGSTFLGNIFIGGQMEVYLW